MRGTTNRLSDRLRVHAAVCVLRGAPPGTPLEAFERQLHADDASLAHEAAAALEAAQRVVAWARMMAKSSSLAEEHGSEMAARLEALEEMLAKEVLPRWVVLPADGPLEGHEPDPGQALIPPENPS